MIDKKLIEKFVKHMGIGVNCARSYPEGHPTMTRAVKEMLDIIAEFPENMPEISLYFLENTIIVEEDRIDAERVPVVQTLLKNFSKIGVKSVTINLSCSEVDVKAFFNVLASTPREVAKYEDISDMLLEKKVTDIVLNEVEFGLVSRKGAEAVKFDWDFFLNTFAGKSGALDEDEKFQSSEFLSEVCGVEEGDSEDTKADKVFKGLDSVSSSIVERHGEEGLREHSLVFSRIVASLSPSVKKRMVGKEAETDRMAAMIREAIKTLSNEDLVEVIMSRVKEGNEKGLEGILSGLPSKRVETLLPALRTKFASSGMEERYTPEFEKLLLKGAGVERDKIENFVNVLKGESEISSSQVFGLLSDVCGIKSDDSENTKADKVFKGLDSVSSSIVESHGEEGLREHSLVFSRIVASLSPSVKKRMVGKEAETDRMAAMIREAIKTLSNEDLVEVIMSRVKEGNEKGLEGVLAGLSAKRAERILNSVRTKFKSSGMEVSYTSELEKGLIKGAAKKRDEELEKVEKLARERSLILTGERYLKKLKKKADEGIAVEDIEAIVKPLIKTLEDPSPEVRKAGIMSLSGMLDRLIDGRKSSAIVRVVTALKEKLDKEESFDVYMEYASILEKTARVLEEKGMEEVSKGIRATFADQIGSEHKRRRAIQALGKVGGKDSLTFLLTALWETGVYKEVRDSIVDVGKEAVPVLIDILVEAEDRKVRKRILDLITTIGGSAVDGVLNLLGDERWFVRRNAVYILGDIGDESVIDRIAPLLEGDRKMVKKEVINTLVKIGGERAEDVIMKTIDDSSFDIQLHAVRALSKLSCTRSSDVLSHRLERDIFVEDEEVLLKKEICRMLAQVGDESSVDSLSKILEEKAFLGRPKYSDEARIEAIYALGKIGTPNAKNLLEGAFKDRSRAISIAAKAALQRLNK